MQQPEQQVGVKRFFIQTFGCQMNEYDSQQLEAMLRQAQYEPAASAEEADLILLNTCSVRDKPEHKVYSLLGRLEKIKADKPHLVIGVTGCVAQQEGKRILARAPGVNLVLGTDNVFELPALLQAVAQGQRVHRTEWKPDKGKVEPFIPLAPARSAAPAQTFAPGFEASSPKGQIAIMKGCDNFCAFCVVPHTRGREVNRPVADILGEARQLVDMGAKEVLLLGQNVNSYKAGREDFVDLLYKLHELPGLARIRYTSPHPKDFDLRLARAHQELDKLCEQVHLPLQSGADAILKTMRRHHTLATYMEKIAMIRELVPHVALSTDIIVGFPGETEADFAATLGVIRQVRFDHLYGFKYSSRVGTPAASLPGQLDEAEKNRRLTVLLDLHEGIQHEMNHAMVGQRQQVLVEGAHPRGDAMQGRTRGNKSTTILHSKAQPGDLVDVEITGVRRFSLVGREVA